MERKPSSIIPGFQRAPVLQVRVPPQGNFRPHCRLWVLEPGNRTGVDARRTLAGRGRSGSGLAGGCRGDALPEGPLSLSHALRPHAEAAGRCACALRALTICALSQCAGLCRAGCERRQRGADGAERSPKAAGRPWICERAESGVGAASAAVSDGEEAEKQERRQVSIWVRSQGPARLRGSCGSRQLGVDRGRGSRPASQGPGPGPRVGAAGPNPQLRAGAEGLGGGGFPGQDSVPLLPLARPGEEASPA